MRHGKKGRKFGRKTGKRRAFRKGLAHNLILKGKIETTEARAKEIRPVVEKLVTLAKKQTLSSLRLLLARLPRASPRKKPLLGAPNAHGHRERRLSPNPKPKKAPETGGHRSRGLKVEFLGGCP